MKAKNSKRDIQRHKQALYAQEKAKCGQNVLTDGSPGVGPCLQGSGSSLVRLLQMYCRKKVAVLLISSM